MGPRDRKRLPQLRQDPPLYGAEADLGRAYHPETWNIVFAAHISLASARKRTTPEDMQPCWLVETPLCGIFS